MNLQGKFLKNTALLSQTFFENTTLLIAEHDEKGALGFIIDKAFGRTLNELEEFKKENDQQEAEAAKQQEEKQAEEAQAAKLQKEEKKAE